jgi:hypothetical protein
MKKLLIFMLVLGMASLANATVIDLVTSGVGDSGNAGTSTDPLQYGEKISIKLVLNYHQQWPSSPSYDGYGLSSMDVSLDAGSAGTFEVATLKAGTASLSWHTNTSTSGVNDESLPAGGAQSAYNVGSDLDQITAVYMTPVRAGNPSCDIVWDITFVAGTTSGEYTIDLGLNGTTQYSVDLTSDGSDTYSGWVNAVEGDLGNLGIHVVPEPATVALLGLGGLFLSRRRR